MKGIIGNIHVYYECGHEFHIVCEKMQTKNFEIPCPKCSIKINCIVNKKTHELPAKEYNRVIADIRNRATWGNATFAERNILKIHDKKHRKNGGRRVA